MRCFAICERSDLSRRHVREIAPYNTQPLVIIAEAHLNEVHRVLKPGGHFYTGMRTKEAMLQFPFVQYGFVLIEPEEWMSILEQNEFDAREAARRLDPVIEGEDGDIQMESVCIEAQKR